MSDDAIKGINVSAVSTWLTHNIDNAAPPFTFKLIAAGGSNLTFRVSDTNDTQWALRRPPVAARLATAHDMQREWNIMAALDQHTDVPVPKMIAYCDDERINDAPFYVMDFVEGLVLRDQASAKGLTPAQCMTATESLVDAQIAFHSADIDAIGLGNLAKTRSGYVERQLNRWRKQVEAAKTRELPLLEPLYQRLLKKIPTEQTQPGLAHGDYRFDNTILDPQFHIAAVLDWELCTVGDPVADFVWSLMYWAEPGDDITWLLDPPTLSENFCSRQTVIERYTKGSGLDLSDLNYYMAFSWWKQACIVEGVYSRLKKGASGGMKVASLDAVAKRVDDYLDKANELAGIAGL